MYLVPLASHQPIPPELLPFDGPGKTIMFFIHALFGLMSDIVNKCHLVLKLFDCFNIDWEKMNRCARNQSFCGLLAFV